MNRAVTSISVSCSVSCSVAPSVHRGVSALVLLRLEPAGQHGGAVRPGAGGGGGAQVGVSILGRKSGVIVVKSIFIRR
jgi:hypothetical protein